MLSSVISLPAKIDKCKNEKARVWCVDLLQTCETVLEAAVLQQEKRDENAEEYLVRVLFTVGEVSLVGGSGCYIFGSIITRATPLL